MMKYFSFLLIIISMIFCSDDNSTNPNTGNDPALIGIWELVSVKIDNDTYGPNEFPDIPAKVEFRADGSGQIWIENYGVLDGIDPIVWSTSGNQLIIEDEVDATYTINNDQLVVNYVEFGQQYEMSYQKSSGTVDDVNSELIGGWELISFKIGAALYNPDELPDVPAKVVFNANGTGQLWIENYGVNDGIDEITWSTDGNQLFIDGEQEATFSITGNTLIIRYFEDTQQIELTYNKII